MRKGKILDEVLTIPLTIGCLGHPSAKSLSRNMIYIDIIKHIFPQVLLDFARVRCIVAFFSLSR